MGNFPDQSFLACEDDLGSLSLRRPKFRLNDKKKKKKKKETKPSTSIKSLDPTKNNNNYMGWPPQASMGQPPQLQIMILLAISNILVNNFFIFKEKCFSFTLL